MPCASQVPTARGSVHQRFCSHCWRLLSWRLLHASAPMSSNAVIATYMHGCPGPGSRGGNLVPDWECCALQAQAERRLLQTKAGKRSVLADDDEDVVLSDDDQELVEPHRNPKRMALIDSDDEF